MKEKHIYKLLFTNGKEYYFSSLAAIYQLFTPKDIGCKVSRLWAIKIDFDRPYRNKLCVISKELVRSKKNK